MKGVEKFAKMFMGGSSSETPEKKETKLFTPWRDWMKRDWNQEFQAKWVDLLELYPKIKPCRLGVAIKKNPSSSIEELKIIIDKRIEEKSGKFTLTEASKIKFEMLKEIFPNFDQFKLKKLILKKGKKMNVEQLAEKVIVKQVKSEKKADKKKNH